MANRGGFEGSRARKPGQGRGRNARGKGREESPRGTIQILKDQSPQPRGGRGGRGRPPRNYQHVSNAPMVFQESSKNLFLDENVSEPEFEFDFNELQEQVKTDGQVDVMNGKKPRVADLEHESSKVGSISLAIIDPKRPFASQSQLQLQNTSSSGLSEMPSTEMDEMEPLHTGLGFVIDVKGDSGSQRNDISYEPLTDFVLGEQSHPEKEQDNTESEQENIVYGTSLATPTTQPSRLNPNAKIRPGVGAQKTGKRPVRRGKGKNKKPLGWDGTTFDDGLDSAISIDKDVDDLAEILQTTTTDDPIFDPKYQQMILNSARAHQMTIDDLDKDRSSEGSEDDSDDSAVEFETIKEVKPQERVKNQKADENNDMSPDFEFDDESTDESQNDSEDSEDGEDEKNFNGRSSRWHYLDKIEDLLEQESSYTTTGKKKRNKGVNNDLFRAIQNGDFDHDEEVTRASNFAARLKRARAKGAPPEPETSLEWELKKKWKLDREKKSEKKRERQLERMLQFQQMGGKKTKKQLKQLAGQTIDLHVVNKSILDFIYNSTQQSLPLRPMSKEMRRKVHLIALEYQLKSRSVGSGPSRYPLLYKTSRTSVPKSNRKIQRLIGPRPPFGPTLKTNEVTSKNIKNFEGAVVGGSANPIEESNLGHQMLVKMGWSKGQMIGKQGGLDVPIEAVVKNSRLGLGA